MFDLSGDRYLINEVRNTFSIGWELKQPNNDTAAVKQSLTVEFGCSADRCDTMMLLRIT